VAVRDSDVGIYSGFISNSNACRRIVISEFESMPSIAQRSANEFTVLCLLSRAALTTEQKARIRRLDFAAIDWTEVTRLAEYHGVLSFVARNLVEYADGLPSEIAPTLRSAYKLNLRRSLWFSAELAGIVRHFKGRQIPVLPFKGPSLEQSIYGEPGLRTFSDLDLLIPPAHYQAAKRSLAELGYKPSVEFKPSLERFWLRNGYEQLFDSASGKNLVELQWALSPRFYSLDLRIEDLMARAEKIVVGGCEMRCLAPEDSILALSVHAAKHLWSRLIWLVDIAESLKTQRIEHEVVAARAGALGVERMLAVAYWLIKNLLDAKLPEVAERMISRDAKVEALGQKFAGRLAREASYDFASTEYFKLILKLRERRSDRYRFLWRLASTPGQSDIDVVDLPEPLFPLYRIVRIGRIFRRRK
jgi:hypothetical protein